MTQIPRESPSTHHSTIPSINTATNTSTNLSIHPTIINSPIPSTIPSEKAILPSNLHGIASSSMKDSRNESSKESTEDEPRRNFVKQISNEAVGHAILEQSVNKATIPNTNTIWNKATHLNRSDNVHSTTQKFLENQANHSENSVHGTKDVSNPLNVAKINNSINMMDTKESMLQKISMRQVNPMNQEHQLNQRNTIHYKNPIHMNSIQMHQSQMPYPQMNQLHQFNSPKPLNELNRFTQSNMYNPTTQSNILHQNVSLPREDDSRHNNLDQGHTNLSQSQKVGQEKLLSQNPFTDGINESILNVPFGISPTLDELLSITDLSVFYQESNLYQYILKYYQECCLNRKCFNHNCEYNEAKCIDQYNTCKTTCKHSNIAQEKDSNTPQGNTIHSDSTLWNNNLHIETHTAPQGISKIVDGNQTDVKNTNHTENSNVPNTISFQGLLESMGSTDAMDTFDIPELSIDQDYLVRDIIASSKLSRYEVLDVNNSNLLSNRLQRENDFKYTEDIKFLDGNYSPRIENAPRSDTTQVDNSKLHIQEIMKWKDCREKYLESHIERLKAFRYACELYKIDNIFQNYLAAEYIPYFQNQVETIELFCWIWILRLENNIAMHPNEENEFRRFIKEEDNICRVNYWVTFELCQSSARFFKIYLPKVSEKWKNGAFTSREVIVRLTPFLQWMTGKKREKVLLFFEKNNLLAD